MKRFLCLVLGLLIASTLIVSVSAGSLDSYFSSGSDKDVRFVSGKENWYKRAWAQMGDCKKSYYLRAYLGNELQDTGKVVITAPIPTNFRLNTNWHFTGTGLSGNLAASLLRAYAFYGLA